MKNWKKLLACWLVVLFDGTDRVHRLRCQRGQTDGSQELERQKRRGTVHQIRRDLR